MTRPEILIRKMASEDIDQVHELDQRSFLTPWPLKSFRYEVEKNKAAQSWVAEEAPENGETKIVGLIVSWLLIDEAHIATIAVSKHQQRKGVASHLLYTALSTLKDKGAIIATLEVRESNQIAKNLYAKFGFIPVGIRKGYFKDSGEDAILMNLEKLNTIQLYKPENF